jgi:tetratricopeptide (TPR) repeat protein
MRQLGITLLISAFVLSGAGSSTFLLAQSGTVSEDPKTLLEKAQAGIEKNPKSAFWHNQASVAYSALGHFDLAVKELELAATLDPDDPGHEYSLFALYQRKGMLRQQRNALLSALEIDGGNPLGHFELGVVLEKEGYLEESLKEYRDAKRLAADVKNHEYTDRRGGAYEIEVVRKSADEYIERVAKLIASKQHEK